MALSGDGRYFYALNTADDRLEIFAAENEGLRSVGETTVGLRPVALALTKLGIEESHRVAAWVNMNML